MIGWLPVLGMCIGSLVLGYALRDTLALWQRQRDMDRTVAEWERRAVIRECGGRVPSTTEGES